ncbi:DNA damage-inducible transcript 4 protein [Misgurnus anguillicaudatus]|uniref:DNA damage-inducible transcript 4 protein n=1 Tax=Misgurnus anguillicaudatus TaxID=75329 RepID=UPI002436018B|nr:DNA damage-inducible transcript 4 protein [Misgurnus anguillicaudatus]
MQEHLISSILSEDSNLPSTPTSDASSKRLSWSRLLQKLHSLDSDSDNQSSTDDQSDTGSISLPDLSESEMFFDPSEEALCKDVVQLIADNLTEAKDGVLHCSKLLIPEKLLEHIGQELVHLSVSEPCGLRGALIDLCVEQGDNCEAVGQIAVDPYLVPTFHLTLVLRLDSKGLWPKIQGLFTGRSPASPVLRHALKLSTGFRVIKRKLYSSEELLIEEC